MKIIRAFVFLMCILPTLASAYVRPSFSPRYGEAMSAVVQQKAASRGFAVSDPRYAMANNAIAAALAGAATAAVGVATLPLWATIASGAALGVAVSLATDSISNWLWNDDGTVTHTGTGGNDPGTGGGSYYRVDDFFGGDPKALLSQSFQDYCWGDRYTNCVVDECSNVNDSYGGNRNLQCYFFGIRADGWREVLTGRTASYHEGTPPTVCGSGQFGANGSCFNYAVPTTTPPFTGNPDDAAEMVPEEDMVKPVNPQIIADSANALWKSASLQPDYQGIPYDAANPITVQDVQAWQAANPSAYPTVSDYLSPAVNPATNTVPFAPPGAQTLPNGQLSPGTNSAPQGSTRVDLGPDPAIGTPNLEGTPTGQQIMQPLTDAMADWSQFALPSQTSACPTASFSWWDRTHTMDAHCTLVDNNKGTITSSMYAFWVIVALFILLGA